MTAPMTQGRRLASYGLRPPPGSDLNTREPTPAQRRRIRHKDGHARRIREQQS